MKNYKLPLFLLLTLASSAFASLPAVIDLRSEGRSIFGNEYIKTVDSNESIVFRFNDGRPHYVEQLLISAQGASSEYSFAKVYADGEEVATLGVPGRDPDYPVIIRGDVSEITLKVQDRSRIRVLGFKIYTERKVYSSYTSMNRELRNGMNLEQWGNSILDLIHEFQCLSRGTDFGPETFSTYFRQLKLAAIKVQASDNAHDARSLSTKAKAEELLTAIDAALPLFESDALLMDTKYDRLGLDLQTIKQDIIEKYDLNRE